MQISNGILNRLFCSIKTCICIVGSSLNIVKNMVVYSPDDHSRVILDLIPEDDDSHYINANYIELQVSDVSYSEFFATLPLLFCWFSYSGNTVGFLSRLNDNFEFVVNGFEDFTLRSCAKQEIMCWGK